jgi:hypothetical protein
LLPRARDSASEPPLAPADSPLESVRTERTMVMEEVAEESAELVARVAALDIGKKSRVRLVQRQAVGSW